MAQTSSSVLEMAENVRTSGRKKVWIDLDNSPHVPFFRPIIEELKKRGYDVVVTARDAYQVRELLDFYGVSGQLIGRHHGKHKLMKALGTFWRTMSLSSVVRKEKPSLGVSHGSRGCLLSCYFLGIPNLTLADYEFTAKVPTIKPTWLMMPDIVPDDRMTNGQKILKYPGIKEDVYLSRFRPDKTLRKRLGIAPEALLITVRPPATEAHYHNPEAEILLTETLSRFVANPEVTVLLLPRNKRQEAELRAAWSQPIASGRILIPEHVEDGMNVIWNSDLVISGGGTMNREAAAMGVPVYSIFRGQIGAVDRYLAEQGRLVLLETVEDVRTRINVVRGEHASRRFSEANSPALDAIVESIASILETPAGGAR